MHNPQAAWRFGTRRHDELQDQLDRASSRVEALKIKAQIFKNYIDMRRAGVPKDKLPK